jgi:proteic killer suppression protein
MIRNFRDRETRYIAQGIRSKRFPVAIQPRARQCLERINAMHHPADLRAFPAMRLEQLKGALAGCYSIRVNRQFRIVFGWMDGSATDVELTDYH